MYILRLAAPAALLLSAALLSPVRAQTAAFSFTPGAYGVEDNAADATGSATGSYSLGFSFTAHAPVFVTSLGYFSDPSFNPNVPFNTVALSPAPGGSYSYTSSHQVGLFQILPGVGGLPETGLLLAETTVTQSSTPSGDFLYHSLLAPVALTPGTSYVLAGVTGPQDPYVFDIQDDGQPGSVGLVVNPVITYGQSRYAISSSLTFPGSTDAFSEPGFFGPNFQFSRLSAPVPEASTLVSTGLLLILGGLAVAARRRSAR